MENNHLQTAADNKTDEKLKIALLRLPAFLIDFILIVLAIVALAKLKLLLGVVEKMDSVYWFMFVIIPLGFFIYWSLNINIGKRLFRLKIIDTESGETPTIVQYFRRCLIFSLLVSLNLVFLIPLFTSKRNQGFQDMLANTLVVRTPTSSCTNSLPTKELS